MTGLTMLVALVAMADTVAIDTPDFDRWNYGFNASPGSRAVGSTFSAFGSEYPFDDRDGQVLLGFVTEALVAPDLPATSYSITACHVSVAIGSTDILFDPTLDPLDSYLDGGQSDGDVGRPIHLVGAGFRNGWSAWTFGEDGDFGDSMGVGVRNCFPVDFDEQGLQRDISNNISEEFVPRYWAVGQAVGVQPGDVIPAYTPVHFELDVDDPDVQCYLRRALADGVLDVMVTSLHLASEPGSGGENAYPDWVLKENALVDLGVVAPAALDLVVEVLPPTGVVGDANHDGVVNVEDLLGVLEQFGRCPCCAADFDDSGFVDVDDLLAVIGGWMN